MDPQRGGPWNGGGSSRGYGYNGRARPGPEAGGIPDYPNPAQQQQREYGANRGYNTGSTPLPSRLPIAVGSVNSGPDDEQFRTSRNFAYPLRPAPPPQQQQRHPLSPINYGNSTTISGRQPGQAIGDGIPRSVPTARRAPPPQSMPRPGEKSGLPRSPKPNYGVGVASSSPQRQAEFETPVAAYRAGQNPVRPVPRYIDPPQPSPQRLQFQPQQQDNIYNDPNSRDANNGGQGSPPDYSTNPQRRPPGSIPPSARRAASSYYSQQTGMQVSPIPEEPSLSRHDSYASSAAIPTSWDPDEFDSSSSSDLDARLPMEGTDGETGLVRQASLGRKAKPTLANIKSPDRTRRRNSGSGGAAVGVPVPVPGEQDYPRSPRSPVTKKSSPVLQVPPAAVSVGGGFPVIPNRSPARSPAPSAPSPLSQPPVAADEYAEKPPIYRKMLDTNLAMAKELGLGIDDTYSDAHGRAPSRSSMRSSRIPGRRVPPRLNMDAVREAEARGSLTSLPDLIRRATKLAAVLETGRPGSLAWGNRGSMFGGSKSHQQPRRDTDSISDILASFPPPVPSSQGRYGNGSSAQNRTMSQWYLPEDYMRGDNGSLRPAKNQRRLCGLPIWAFIILVILALIVITAAVVVPLQLVNISRSNGGNNNGKNNLNAAFEACRKSNPCENGGENIATRDFCGCICTNGFTGADCSERDPSTDACTSFDFEDRQQPDGQEIEGIKNATIGSALPRLFAKGQSSYNVPLDPSLLLGVFSKGNISCTLQNALVTFNGESIPSGSRRLLRLIKRQIQTDPNPPSTPTSSASASATSTTPLPTASGSRDVALDADAVDFARVAVLYVAQIKSIDTAEEARGTLDSTFREGTDFGDVVSGNVTFKLDTRAVVVDGRSVGGVKSTGS